MSFDLNTTLVLLGLIWLITVILAFKSARIPTGSNRKFIATAALMLLLLVIAVILVADHWYVDLM